MPPPTAHRQLRTTQRPLVQAFVRRLLRAVLSGRRCRPVDGEICLDPHVHTEYSYDCSAPLRELLLAAAGRGLHGLAVADHDTCEGAVRAQEVAEGLKDDGLLPGHFLVIPAQEVSSRHGHIVGLFTAEAIPRRMSAAETVAAIHDQDGLAVAAHPFAGRNVGRSLGPAAWEIPFDAIEEYCLSVWPHRIRPAVIAAHDLATADMANLASSDSHNLYEVGAFYTAVRAHAPTLEAVRDALVRGHTRPCPLRAARLFAGPHPTPTPQRA
ncbi:MAG: PHP domain-containing protein [Armatimonadota bacterium]